MVAAYLMGDNECPLYRVLGEEYGLEPSWYTAHTKPVLSTIIQWGIEHKTPLKRCNSLNSETEYLLCAKSF